MIRLLVKVAIFIAAIWLCSKLVSCCVGSALSATRDASAVSAEVLP